MAEISYSPLHFPAKAAKNEKAPNGEAKREAWAQSFEESGRHAVYEIITGPGGNANRTDEVDKWTY